jgi:hypothetical protein
MHQGLIARVGGELGGKHARRDSRAFEPVDDELAGVCDDLDLPVVVGFVDKYAEVAAEIDQSGALVVQLEFDAPACRRQLSAWITRFRLC